MTEGTRSYEFIRSETFRSSYDTAAGMTNNLIDETPKNFPRRLVSAKCTMIGAGGATDTIKLQKVVAPSTVTDITDAVDVSAKSDKVPFDFGTYDKAQMDFNNGDWVRILTVSDALCRVDLVWVILQATP